MADRKEIKAKLLESLYKTTAFFLTRFPYASALLLMMTTAEAFKTNLSVERSRLTLSHIHVGVLFVSATAMSFNMFGTKRFFALVTAAQYAVLSVDGYIDKNKREVTLVSLTYACFVQRTAEDLRARQTARIVRKMQHVEDQYSA